MNDTLEYVPGARCPVCGKQAICVVDRAGNLPVTLCLHCDAQQMIADMGLSRWRVWQISTRAWLGALVESGMAGALLALVLVLCLFAASMLPAEQETPRQIAGLLGIAAALTSFQLYVFPLGMRWRNKA